MGRITPVIFDHYFKFFIASFTVLKTSLVFLTPDFLFIKKRLVLLATICLSAGFTEAQTTPGSGTTSVTSCTWTGANDNRWSLPINWACGVLPTAETDVIIPTGTVNPIVDIPAIANNIIFGTGTKLTVSGSVNTLTLYGSLIGPQNTLNAIAGKLILAGSDQVIQSAGYGVLELNGAGLKTFDVPNPVPVIIRDSLILNNGWLVLGNHDLTIEKKIITNASAASYVVTNSFGTLKIAFTPGGTTLFPVGSGPASYTPLYITNPSNAAMTGVRVQNMLSNGVGGTIQTSLVVGKTWYVRPDAKVFMDMTFQWNADDETPGFDRNACVVSSYGSFSWQSVSPLTAASGNNPYTRTATNFFNNSLTATTPFGIGSTGSALPVRLISFSGSAAGNINKLQWVTNAEIAFNRFVIEKSSDGQNFTETGNVPAAGNSSTEKTYYFSDEKISSINYYRLKLVDNDGHFTYSNIILIKNTVKAITVRPNPFTDKIAINILSDDAAKADLLLSDATGRIMLHSTLLLQKGNNTIRYDQLGKLSRGVYFLKIKNETLAEMFRLTKVN